MVRIKWIESDNFDLLATGGSASLEQFMDETQEEYEFRVAYDELTPKQKKMLPSIRGDFKVYASTRARPPATLKDKLIKEVYYDKKDIIDLIKMIIKETDRDKVYRALKEYDIHPIVLSIWLYGPFKGNPEALDRLLYLEKYIYNKDAYYIFIAANFKGKMPGVKFRFPCKLR